MELERAEAVIKELLAPKYLSPPQKMVFRAAWEGQSYRDLAGALATNLTISKELVPRFGGC